MWEKTIGVFLVFDFRNADFDWPNEGNIRKGCGMTRKKEKGDNQKGGDQIVINPSLPLLR
jgi:hypothetical protein